MATGNSFREIKYLANEQIETGPKQFFELNIMSSSIFPKDAEQMIKETVANGNQKLQTAQKYLESRYSPTSRFSSKFTCPVLFSSILNLST